MNTFLVKITINRKLIHHLYCLVNIWTAILKKANVKICSVHLFMLCDKNHNIIIHQSLGAYLRL